ncbi:MAG: M23 family metallopeptidase [Bacteroidota bacterium]
MKTNIFQLFLIIFVIGFVTSYSQSQINQNFILPIKSPVFYTGNYAELRGTHFHAGIDIKTDGEEGMQVFSIADGYVSRIKISPFGYGKTIYISHPSGYTSVYAHLQKFSLKIDSVTKNEHYSESSYSIDFELDSDVVPVVAGEEIALSGNTGFSEGPHLHFEIRETNSEVPLNPFRFFNIMDNIPPEIKSFTIYSFKDSSNNVQYDKINFITDKKNDTYYKTLNLNGKIGFGIETYDKINGSENICSVYSIELFQDSILICKIVLDSIAFSESVFMKSYIDYEGLINNNQKIHKLFLEQNSPLSIYKSLNNKGFVDPHNLSSVHLKVKVYDYNQNSASLDLYLKINDSITSDYKNYQTGESVRYNEPYLYEEKNIVVKIPENALVKDEYINIYADSIKNKSAFSQLYIIGQNSIPLVSQIEISIKPDTIPENKTDKILVACITKKGNIINYGGDYEDGFIKTKTINFGKYTLLIDTTPPVIKPLNIYNNAKFIKDNSIRIKITDNLSGIKSYNGYIDGKWVLFEYEPKKAQIEYFFDTKVVKNHNKHQLLIEVTDDRDNISAFQCEFYY